MKVRVKKCIKKNDCVAYHRQASDGCVKAAVVDDMLLYRGKIIEVVQAEFDDWYIGVDNDWVWHRSWFVIPRQKNKAENAVEQPATKQSTPCCDTPNILPYGLNEVMCYNCNTVVKK